MKRFISFLAIFMLIFCTLSFAFGASAAKDYEAFAAKLDKTVYDGELGAIYSKDSTTFRVWAPTSDNVKVKFYKNSTSTKYTRLVNMSFDKSTGVWSAHVSGDIKG